MSEAQSNALTPKDWGTSSTPVPILDFLRASPPELHSLAPLPTYYGPTGTETTTGAGPVRLDTPIDPVLGTFNGVPITASSVRRLREAASNAIDLGMNFAGPIDAYHGTRHTFPPKPGAPLGEFDFDAIGSGEGIQMQGHGMYLAKRKGVSEYYMKAGLDDTNKILKLDGKPIDQFSFPYSPEPGADRAIQYYLDYDGDTHTVSKLLEKRYRIDSTPPHAGLIDEHRWEMRPKLDGIPYDEHPEVRTEDPDFPSPAGIAIEHYMNTESGMDSVIDHLMNQPEEVFREAGNWLAANRDRVTRPSMEEAKKELETLQAQKAETSKAALDWFNDNHHRLSIEDPPPGNLYHVQISPDEHELLDWDRPFESHTPEVQAKIQKAFESFNTLAPAERLSGMTGEDIYNVLKAAASGHAADQGIPRGSFSSAPAASKALDDAGIPGLRYLDGASRKLPPGHPDITHNYVIFHPQHLRIVGRNGQMLGVEPVDHDPFAESP